MIFQDFFKNPNYSDPNAFLACGPEGQTVVTPEIRAVADGFDTARNLSILSEIIRWMRANLRDGEAEKFSRTSHEILQSRISSGCADYGLVFVALARSRGMPCVFVQTTLKRWVKKSRKRGMCVFPIEGHIFVEVYIKGKWYLVDPSRGILLLDYDKDNMTIRKEFCVFAKSLEVWDTGIHNLEENNSTMIRLFL